jgi:hypothetical protein
MYPGSLPAGSVSKDFVQVSIVTLSKFIEKKESKSHFLIASSISSSVNLGRFLVEKSSKRITRFMIGYISLESISIFLTGRNFNFGKEQIFRHKDPDHRSGEKKYQKSYEIVFSFVNPPSPGHLLCS